MTPFSYYCFLSSVFAVPFSLPLARSLLLISLISLVVELIKSRKSLTMPASAWACLAFIAAAIIATFFGINPALGVGKLDKLAWFIALPVAATLITSRARLTQMLKAYTFGATLLSLEICILRPIASILAANSTPATSFMDQLTSRGSMTDGQQIMLATIACLGFMLYQHHHDSDQPPAPRSCSLWHIIILILTTALIINDKRGSLFCTITIAAVFLGLRHQWKRMIILVAIALLTLSSPRIRTRISHIQQELNVEYGGRMAMWTKVAPAIIKKHPFGIGHRALTNSYMRSIYRRIEPNRDHLHSNLAQVLIATGWAGATLWLLWMFLGLRDALRSAAKGPRAPPLEPPPTEQSDRATLLLMLFALLANGLVEYNFGDAELVLVYSFLIGAAAAIARLSRISA